jgi:hypothetical protein
VKTKKASDLVEGEDFVLVSTGGLITVEQVTFLDRYTDGLGRKMVRVSAGTRDAHVREDDDIPVYGHVEDE